MSGPRDRRDREALSDEFNAKGIEFAERGWLGEAASYFRKALDETPDEGHIWDNLASVLADDGQLREALTAHLRAVEHGLEVAAARYNLAAFLLGHGVALAESELRQSLELEAGAPDALLSLAMALAEQGRSDEAAESFEEAILAAPADTLALHEFALLLIERGDMRKAAIHLRETVRLEPENFEAWMDLAGCYADRGFFDEARGALDAAEVLNAEDAHLHYARAGVEVLSDELERGFAALGRAMALDAPSVRSWLDGDHTFDPLREHPDFANIFSKQ